MQGFPENCQLIVRLSVHDPSPPLGEGARLFAVTRMKVSTRCWSRVRGYNSRIRTLRKKCVSPFP